MSCRHETAKNYTKKIKYEPDQIAFPQVKQEKNDYNDHHLVRRMELCGVCVCV